MSACQKKGDNDELVEKKGDLYPVRSHFNFNTHVRL